MALRTRNWILIRRRRLDWLLRQEQMLMYWGSESDIPEHPAVDDNGVVPYKYKPKSAKPYFTDDEEPF